MIEELPRLAPHVIERTALIARLRADAEFPLRLLVAPAGSGKTTLAVEYARSAVPTVRYLALPSACDAPTLRDLIARIEPGTHEIVVDEIDNATPDALALLRSFITDARSERRFIYAARSLSALDIRREIAQGLVALIDATDLAFGASDVRALAQRYGTPYTHADVARLLAATEGWAIVVAAVVRRAALEGRSLENAFEHWRRRDAFTLQAFVERELESTSEEDRRAFALALSGVTRGAESRMRGLYERGFFVRRCADSYRVYTALLLMETGRFHDVRPADDLPMSVQLFGTFSASIGAHPVDWVRKRDAQIIKYLLLATGARATRKEVIDAFWPQADPHLAQQSLRTACSNIRKAIAAIVGYDRVEAYIRVSATDISLDPERVTTDTRSFASQVHAGDAAFQRGNFDEALQQYETARALYLAPVLGGEADEPWVAPVREHYEELYVLALERLAEIAIETGDTAGAREHIEELLRLRPANTTARRLLAPRAPAPVELGIERRRFSIA